MRKSMLLLSRLLSGPMFALALLSQIMTSQQAIAQDVLPHDNGLATYHTSPRYRESESHPLRVAAYVLHPVGWLAREVLFRPLSYFASSTETTRSVMGYREPYDYRQPECFSADDSMPDCRALSPFNYGSEVVSPAGDDTGAMAGDLQPQVYFPDVNFDFDVKKLNDLGEGRAHQLADLLKSQPNVHVVLQGHADYLGDEKYNEKLGLDRSETLRQELLSLGVTAERLSTVTFGETKPLYSEQADWARAVNRRVEVHVSEDSAQ